MAKDKDRALNPAAAQRKAEKAKAIKKSKIEQQTRRNERLVHRNPDRIQRQIDDLKALEASGEIKAREKTVLADLERDLKLVRKAKEALGDKAPQRSQPQHGRGDKHRDGNANHTILGKRRYDGERKPYTDNRESDSGNETDESVRAIPMPRDTPPPMSRRMPYNNSNNNSRNQQNPNDIPITSGPHSLPPKPNLPIEAKTTYSSAPQIRDLKKEAVSRFVPTIVKRKQDAIKGVNGGLLEPEEMDRLEQEGYLAQTQKKVSDQEREISAADLKPSDEESKRLAEEEARFERELAMGTVGEEDSHEPTQAPPSTERSDSDLPVDTVPHTQRKPPGLSSGLVADYSSSEDEGEIDIAPQKTGGLFSKLPKPQQVPSSGIRRVEIEEVEDEDM